ncbi:hypothetical protein UY3_09827 [Chelonia mydas]|uniref:Uncharacterized protein n=1 Tax=Chelonia mydas TaxID=8469 RepID=M7BBV0_CHEMY|nr:hypothetical protein UY3_09827 [Chelonia mydas]
MKVGQYGIPFFPAVDKKHILLELDHSLSLPPESFYVNFMKQFLFIRYYLAWSTLRGGELSQYKLRNFSYENSVAEVNVLRATYRIVFTAVGRLLTLPCRLRLRFSLRWSTGVNGRALGGQFIASSLDPPAGSIAPEQEHTQHLALQFSIWHSEQRKPVPTSNPIIA